MANTPSNVASYPAVVGAILVARRKELGLPQAQVAEAVGLAISTWSRIENGESALTIEQLALVACALKLSPSEVLAAAEAKMAALLEKGVSISPSRTDTAASAASGAIPLMGASLASALGPVGWLAGAAGAAAVGYQLFKRMAADDEVTSSLAKMAAGVAAKAAAKKSGGR